MENVLQCGYYRSILDYDNVDWFSIENLKLENKMDFYLQNSKKDILMTEKDEEDHKNNSICRFCGKAFLIHKIEIFVI